MIETDKVDLREDFEVHSFDCDDGLDFPGYSIEAVHGAHEMVRLVKISSQA
jgi:hypothetical protein